MEVSRLKTLLAGKSITIGSWLTLADPDVCEMMCKAGFDWLTIDMEHSSIGLREMSRLIQIIDLSGLPALVRVANNDLTMIKQAMDCGATGIIVPMVNSADQARSAVAAAKYPPVGHRGVGLYRAQKYGCNFGEYQKNAEENSVVIVQIEHKNAIECLDEIMAVDGVDGYIIGPYDLSGSYGKPGEFDDVEVQQALDRSAKYACEGKKAAGIHIVHGAANSLQEKINEGYTFIAYGSDMLFLLEKIQKERELIGSVRDKI